MSYTLWYIGYCLIGVVLGFLTLSWGKPGSGISNTHFGWIATWIGLWPLLLLAYIWVGLAAWRERERHKLRE